MKLRFAHENPRIAAAKFADADLTPAIIETACALRATRENHRAQNSLSAWAVRSRRNFQWLVDFGFALLREHLKRNGKPHPLTPALVTFSEPPQSIPTNALWTPPPGLQR